MEVRGTMSKPGALGHVAVFSLGSAPFYLAGDMAGQPQRLMTALWDDGRILGGKLSSNCYI